MKFSVKINGTPADGIEAKTPNAAVDAARAAHAVPDEGGDFLIEVSDEAGVVVSSFGVSHEPKPHVAEAVYAKREADALAKEKADERAALKAELLAEIAAEKVSK